jgi:hypothetical protein
MYHTVSYAGMEKWVEPPLLSAFSPRESESHTTRANRRRTQYDEDRVAVDRPVPVANERNAAPLLVHVSGKTIAGTR